MQPRKKQLSGLDVNSLSHRRYLIKNRVLYPFGSLCAAAVEIQRVVRGYQCRRQVFNLQPNYRQIVEEEKIQKRLYINCRYESTIEFIRESSETKSRFLGMYQSIIQSRILAVIVKHPYMIQMNQFRFWMYHAAAITIQRGYRKHKQYLTKTYGSKRFIAKGKVRFYDPKEDAASIIQRCWRSFFNNQIYKFYRDLIVFKERLDPITILRGINPLEANLVDAASKIHVRFRLGGLKFPPMILYKIYTHSPIVDINAFAPRDYVREKHMCDPKILHSHSPLNGLVENTKEGWYQRYENNGWRPVSSRNLNDFYFDTSEISVSKAVKSRISKDVEVNKSPIQHFHFSTVHRKQDIILKKKRRKVEWLKKMYKMNMKQQQGLEFQENKAEPNSNLRDNVFDFDDELNNIEENRLQEILNWSNSLDFENYVQEWTGLAITLPSDHFIHHVSVYRSVEADGIMKINEETSLPYEVGAKRFVSQTEMADSILFGGVEPSAAELYHIERAKLMDLLNSK